MPIGLDFPEITDAFRQFLLLPVRQIAHSFEMIALWLSKRVRTADIIEQASRGYPVIRFMGDAVGAWLDDTQKRGLAPDQPDPTIGDRLSDGGRRFLAGIRGIKDQVTDALILPDTFATFDDALGEIGSSVDRFGGPPAAMSDQLFGHSWAEKNDPERRQAGDLWGEAALFWRSLAGSIGQLKDFVSHVGVAYKLFTGGGGPAADPTPWPERFERYARFVLGAVMVLPTLPAFARLLWDSLVIQVKQTVIARFAAIEARVNAFRFTILRFVFNEFPAMLRQALSYMIAAQLVLIANVRFFGIFALRYAALAQRQLTTWFNAMRDYLNSYIHFVTDLLDTINFILSFDIGTVLAIALGDALGPIKAAALMAAMPNITIDELVTDGTSLSRGVTRMKLTAYSLVLRELADDLTLHVLMPRSIQNRLDAIPSLMWNLFRKPPPFPAETAPLRFPPGHHFPDLFATIFRPALAGVRGAINDIARSLPHAVGEIVGSGYAALNIIGDNFADEAEHVNDITVASRFAHVADTAARQSEAVFGPDTEEMRKALAGRTPDKLADAMGDWLATGGFTLLTEAIPAYFREMRDFWQEREAHGEQPTMRLDMTSPRILAERAMLARSHVKQVVIRAPGKEPDRSLAETVAGRFRDAVQQAFIDGEARLHLYAVSTYV